MPKLEPFKGILYNPKNVNVSSVVAPPYDVISPQMQDELYRTSEYNIIRLILGKEEPADSKCINKYTRASQFFNNWLRNEILVQDKAPAMYIYSQEYFYENKKKTRVGFIARMKIEDPRTSRVLPHEYTFAKPKEDRLNLIREVKANLCPIFSLFQDDKNEVSTILKGILKKGPIFDVDQEGVRHKFWILTNKTLIKKIQDAMLDKDIFIADGHHRYEVAVLYRDEMRKKTHNAQERSLPEGRAKPPRRGRTTHNAFDYVMMYFSPINDEGLTILSTHRLIKKIDMEIKEILEKLKRYFDIKTFRSSKDMFKKMTSAGKEEYLFGMYFKNKTFYLLKLKDKVALDELIKEDKSSEWKKLDVSVLHGLILDRLLGLRNRIQEEGNIIYTRDADFAIAEVNRNNCEVAFFLNPTKVSQVRAIAQKGDKMPHKSTYFYPKLLSGLVINRL